MASAVRLQGMIPGQVPGPVVVATDASVKGLAHSSGYIASYGAWGIAGWQYGNSHPCMTPENTGCTLATELRAIFYGIVDIPVDTPITVYTDSRGAAQQVAAWQRGQNKLPPWYSTERSHGNKPTLVQLLERVKESGSLLTVEWVKGHNSNLYNEAADALARLGMRVLTDRLKVADAETRAVRLVSGFIKTIATTTRP